MRWDECYNKITFVLFYALGQCNVAKNTDWSYHTLPCKNNTLEEKAPRSVEQYFFVLVLYGDNDFRYCFLRRFDKVYGSAWNPGQPYIYHNVIKWQSGETQILTQLTSLIMYLQKKCDLPKIHKNNEKKIRRVGKHNIK